jgi:hypothetical protein
MIRAKTESSFVIWSARPIQYDTGDRAMTRACCECNIGVGWLLPAKGRNSLIELLLASLSQTATQKVLDSSRMSEIEWF